MEGDPKYGHSQCCPTSRTRATPSCSASRASASTTPTRSAPPGSEALAADRPVLIEAITDPEVPPLPPHITLEQAKNFMRALRQATPSAARVIKESFRQKIEELISGTVSDHRDARPVCRRRSRASTVSAYTVPDRRAGVRRHARVGLDDDRRRRGARRRQTGLGYTYAPAAAGGWSTRSSPAWSRARRARTCAPRWRRDGARCATRAGPGSASARCPRSTSRSGT